MNNWGISQRILSLAITPTILVAVLLGTFFINNHINDSKFSLESRGNTIATHLALASEYGLITLDNDTLKDMAQSARDNDKDLISIVIFDKNNRRVVSVGTPNHLQKMSLTDPSSLTNIGSDSNLLKYTKTSSIDEGRLFHAPIISKVALEHESWQIENRYSNQVLGYVAVLMTEEFTLVSRFQNIIATFIIVVLGLLIGVFLARRMSSSVTLPITNMAQGVEKIKDGNLNTRIEGVAHAELKTLQSGINQMAENLEHNQEELQLAVEQATADLQETLETLEVNNLELDIARRQAIEASRIKTEFLANMSHEIRTPMNGVIGFTDLLLKTELNNKQKDFMFDIKRSASSLLSIIDDILDYSKIEAGKMSLERYPFDLRECVDDVFKMVGNNANQKGLELVSLIYSDVPKGLLGDPIRIKQIITNLISNAIKFTKSGSIELHTEVESENKQGLKLKIQVKDSGIGLSEQQQQNLFKAFSQADASTKREFGGTGLGLVISKSLVEKMGGEIGVESASEQGSVFWFTLKCERAEASADDGLTSEFIANKSALVFDPHPATRLSITQILEEWQMMVLSFNNIDDLITEMELYTQSGKDIELIVIGGQRFRRRHQQLEYISNQALAQKCPVITYSMSEDDEHIEQLDNMGVSRALCKPVTYRALYNTLIELLRSPHGKQQPREIGHKQDVSLLKHQYILAVDDNAANLRLVATLLEDLGMKVDRAESGMQAVSLSKDKLYDAILMDIQMPEMDGLEATRTIRANQTNEKTPIIALTAHAMANERELLLEAGMDDYMTKPVSEQDLINMLLKWLHQEDQALDVSSLEEPVSSKTLDWELSLKLSNNNAQLAKDMLQMLVQTNDETSQSIHAAYQAQNFEELLQQVHKLHGASCYLGTPVLKSISSQYETRLKKQQYNQLEDLHEDLLNELININRESKNFLEDTPA